MRTFLIFLLFAIFLTACQKSNEVQVKIEINDPELSKLLITNEVDMFYDTIDISSEKELTLTLEDSPSVFLVRTASMFTYFFAKAGDQVIISKSPEFQEIIVRGSSDLEQELLSEFSKSIDIAITKYSLNEIAKSDEDEFLRKLDEKYQAPRAILAAFESKGANKDLINMLEGRIEADFAACLSNYPNYYNFHNKKRPSLSNKFLLAAGGFDFDRKALFHFEDVVRNANVVVGRPFNFGNYESIGAYFAEIYRNVDNLVSNSKVAELLKFKTLMDKISMSGGTIGMEKEIESFLSSSQDPHRKKLLENEMAMWAHLQEGMAAPEFTAYTRDGEEVKLSDLKGKNVYIDVWATWCGPCIREIPALKSMEEKYHDENLAFVSVSIDKESDREKWKKFVQDRNLGGIQIMAKNEWQSQLTQNYNISGIPRFIMVDSNGALVNADAPRPSNTAAFNKMMQSLLN